LASLRKRYRPAIEERPDKDGVVAATPVQAAEPPPVADAAKPADLLKPEHDPVEDAAASALKQRLREMERAEQAVQQANHQPRMATEPPPTGLNGRPLTVEEIIANTTLPDRAKNWLRRHPDYATDPAKTNRLLVLDEIATHRAGGQFTEAYFEQMEDLLGFRRREPTRAEILAHLERMPETTTATSPRNAAPLRQRPPAAPVSAPVHRDPPSMANGRPASQPTQLTQEQRELARSLGLTDEQYRDGLRRMNAEKAAGLHQNGR
jgi:hypothetical protein